MVSLMMQELRIDDEIAALLKDEVDRLREALSNILNTSHGEGIHIEGRIAKAALKEVTMSVMDSIEEKYEEQIAALKKEVAALRKDYNRTVDERDNAYFEIERLKFGQESLLCPRTDK